MQRRNSLKSERFENLAEDESCVMGIGWCATHNCKLVQDLKVKKTSMVEKDSTVKWTQLV